jgi:hypothetical protein
MSDDYVVRKAFIEDTDDGVTVHIGTLTINVRLDAEDGPIALSEGGDCGVSIWEQDAQYADEEGRLVFGGGRLLGHVNLRRFRTDQIRERLLQKSILDEGIDNE